MFEMRVRMLTLLVTASVVIATLATPAFAIGPFLQVQDSEDAGMGYGLGLKHSILGPIPIIGFDLRASWLHYADEDKLVSSFELFPLEAVGTVKLGIFYAGLGLGYYVASGDIKPDNEVGGFLAGGLSFGLGGLSAFAELRYLKLEPGAADMSGVGANIGVTLPL